MNLSAQTEVGRGEAAQPIAPKEEVRKQRQQSWSEALQATDILAELHFSNKDLPSSNLDEARVTKQNLAESSVMGVLESSPAAEKLSDPEKVPGAGVDQAPPEQDPLPAQYRAQVVAAMQKADKVVLLERWGHAEIDGGAVIAELKAEIAADVQEMEALDHENLSAGATQHWGSLSAIELHRTFTRTVASHYADWINPTAKDERQVDADTLREGAVKLRNTARILDIYQGQATLDGETGNRNNTIMTLALERNAEAAAAGLAVFWKVSPSLLAREKPNLASNIVNTSPEVLAGWLEKAAAMLSDQSAAKDSVPAPVPEPRPATQVQNPAAETTSIAQPQAKPLEVSVLRSNAGDVFLQLDRLEDLLVRRNPADARVETQKTAARELMERMGIKFDDKREKDWQSLSLAEVHMEFCSLVLSQYQRDDQTFATLASLRHPVLNARTIATVISALERKQVSQRDNNFPLLGARSLSALQYYDRQFLDPIVRLNMRGINLVVDGENYPGYNGSKLLEVLRESRRHTAGTHAQPGAKATGHSF